MVEITYQMVLGTLQTVGLLVGIYYYIMTLSYTRKNQEISLRNQEETLKTRKATLFHQTVGQILMNSETLKHMLRLQSNPFSSVEEYNELVKDPDYALANVFFRNWFEIIGNYLRYGLIDIEMFAEYQPYITRWLWNMSKESIYDQRKTIGPSLYRNMEYLMNAMEQFWKEHPETAP